MAKNQSLPAHLQEKDSRGEENLTMYEHPGKPTAWWPRPSFSNSRSTNDIVWAFSEIVSLQLQLHIYMDSNYSLSLSLSLSLIFFLISFRYTHEFFLFIDFLMIYLY